MITSLQTGGAEKLMVDLLPRLREKGADVDLAVFQHSETDFYHRLLESRVTVHRLSENKVYSPKNLYKLKKLIDGYDIIHAHNSICQLYTALSGIGKNKILVTTEHSTSNRRRSMPCYAPIDRWMYSRYDKIICISKKAETQLRKHLRRDDSKILTINNGIDVSAYENALPATDLRSHFPEGSRLITMVGSFRDAKDQDTLITGLSLLPERFKLLLVGQGERRRRLEMAVKDANVAARVYFTGVRNDIPCVLKASDYVAMSSHWEGLSLSSVEGMASGRPMLASDVNGLREVVDGGGLLFSQGDAREFADLVLKLDRDNSFYESISERGKARARMFDISKMVEGYMRVYSELISKR